MVEDQEEFKTQLKTRGFLIGTLAAIANAMQSQQ